MKILLVLVGIPIAGGLLVKIIYDPENSLGAILALLVFIGIVTFYLRYEKRRQQTFMQENIQDGKARSTANWYVAVTHYLTTNIIYFIPALIISVIIRMVTVELWQGILVLLILNIPALMLAVWYASKYVNRSYILSASKKQKIIQLGMLYYLVTHVAFLYFTLDRSNLPPNMAISVTNLVEIIILFYIFSNKYITVNQEE